MRVSFLGTRYTTALRKDPMISPYRLATVTQKMVIGRRILSLYSEAADSVLNSENMGM